MDKDRVLELAWMARDYWEADCVLSAVAAAEDFVSTAQRALSRTAEEGGYAEEFNEAVGWESADLPVPDDGLAVDWREARRIAVALEEASREHNGPWRALYVEGTLCYAHQIVHGGNLARFVECWDEGMEGLPKWRQLTGDKKLVLVLRSARAHFIADLDLTADDFTTRMDPTMSDGASGFLDPVPAHAS